MRPPLNFHLGLLLALVPFRSETTGTYSVTKNSVTSSCQTNSDIDCDPRIVFVRAPLAMSSSSSSSSEEEEIVLMPKRSARRKTMAATVVKVQPVVHEDTSLDADDSSSSEEDEMVYALVRSSRKNIDMRPLVDARLWEPSTRNDEKYLVDFDVEAMKQQLLDHPPSVFEASRDLMSSSNRSLASEEEDEEVKPTKVWFSSALYQLLEKNEDGRWPAHHILLLTEAIEYGEKAAPPRDSSSQPSSLSPDLRPQPLRFVESFAVAYPEPMLADWNAGLRFVLLHPQQRILFDLLMFMFTATAERHALTMMRDSRGMQVDARFHPDQAYSQHPQGTQVFSYAQRKTQGMELQALQALVNAGVPWLSFPLMVIFTFETSRVCVQSVAPEQRPQLLLECFGEPRVDSAMRSVGVALNVSCGPFSFVGPWDLRVRLLVEAAPWIHVSNATHLLPGPSEHQRFRQELLWRRGVAACSDVWRPEVHQAMADLGGDMSAFTAEADEVATALNQQVAALKGQVDHSRTYPKVPLKALFHAHGVNKRHLGKVGLLGCVKPAKLDVQVKLLHAVRFPSALRQERVQQMQQLMGVQEIPPTAPEDLSMEAGSLYLKKAMSRRRYDFIREIAAKFRCYDEALPVCARMGQLENTQYLLDCGARCADIAEFAIQGGIFQGLQLNLPPAEELLLIARYGPDDRLMELLEKTPATEEALRIAAGSGQLVACQILLGLVMNRRQDATTPLGHEAAAQAASAGHLQVVQFLMQCQELADASLVELLCRACAANRVNMARFLISRGAAVNREDSEDARPLEHAVRHDHLEVADLLLTQGATLVYGEAPPSAAMAALLRGDTPLRSTPVKMYSSGPVLLRGPAVAPVRFAAKTRELLEAARGEAGWHLVKVKNDVQIYRNKGLGEGVHCFRGRGVIKRPAKEVMRVLWERTGLMKFDPFCQFITITKVLNESTRLTLREYHAKRCVVGLYRDFLVQDHLVQTEQRGYVLVSHSGGVDQKSAPSIPNSTRATLHCGGWVVEPLGSDPKHSCAVTYVVRVDLKGIPPAITNIANISQPLLIHKLRRYMAESGAATRKLGFPVTCIMCAQCFEDIPIGEKTCEVCGHEMKKRTPPPVPPYKRKPKAKPPLHPGAPGLKPPLPPPRNAALGGALDLTDSGEHDALSTSSFGSRSQAAFLAQLHASTGM